MKRFILTVLLAVLVLIAPAIASAAGSSVAIVSDKILAPGLRVIEILFTADDTDGSIPALTLNNATTGIVSTAPAGSPQARAHNEKHTLFGWYAYKLIIDGNHAGTEPTEDSDIIIEENGIDLLGGNGTDLVDNTDERETLFKIGSTAATQPFLDTWTITITQAAEATNSATVTAKIVMTQ